MNRAGRHSFSKSRTGHLFTKEQRHSPLSCGIGPPPTSDGQMPSFCCCWQAEASSFKFPSNFRLMLLFISSSIQNQQRKWEHLLTQHGMALPPVTQRPYNLSIPFPYRTVHDSFWPFQLCRHLRRHHVLPALHLHIYLHAVLLCNINYRSAFSKLLIIAELFRNLP